ncbi:unnamed protein product [Toxocara canis]|uniref:Uncharacterized protein n=1 Tax=Toxocara canis TaxID=6265 RepID=A0A3P7G2I5_TOXCA|nr:unnamed protein product [Toxocara canis]
MKGRRIYVLESPTFTLNNDSVLTFDLYRRSAAISLQVFFVATQWKKFKWLAIDNIALNYGIPCREGFVKKPT